MAGKKPLKITKTLSRKAYHLKRKGFSDSQVAYEIGISHSTYQKYKKQFTKNYKQFDLARKKKLRDTGKISKGGRPKGSAIRERVTPEILTALAIAGYSKAKVVKILGIGNSTWYQLLDNYPELADAWENGKANTDRKIISALVERALGYEHDDIHFSSFQGEVTQTRYRKKYAPDTQALTLYLINKLGWKREPDSNGNNSKGKILEALDAMMEEEGEV